MAKLQFKRIGSTVAWAASGSISLELSPIPWTMTQLLIVAHADITTTTATFYSDPYPRFFSRLSLSGQVNNENKTFMDFSSPRAASHLMRAHLGRFAVPKPTIIADSQTNSLVQFAELFHWGVRPVLNDRLNPFDMTAGIPATQKGQLTLGGTFGAAAAMGSNVTVNATASCFIEVYAIGVMPDPGDPPEMYLPQAYPVWSQQTITGSATSTTFATSHNITAGGFIHSMLYFATNGSNAPRDRVVLNSLRLYNQLENREVLAFGGRAGSSDAAGGDYEVAEIYSQLFFAGAPRSEFLGHNGGTSAPGVPSLSQAQDPGIVYFPLHALTTRVHPLYGADMRQRSTGDLRLDRGLADVTGTTEDLLYLRYELASADARNAGWL